MVQPSGTTRVRPPFLNPLKLRPPLRDVSPAVMVVESTAIQVESTVCATPAAQGNNVARATLEMVRIAAPPKRLLIVITTPPTIRDTRCGAAPARSTGLRPR